MSATEFMDEEKKHIAAVKKRALFVSGEIEQSSHLFSERLVMSRACGTALYLVKTAELLIPKCDMDHKPDWACATYLARLIEDAASLLDNIEEFMARRKKDEQPADESVDQPDEPRTKQWGPPAGPSKYILRYDEDGKATIEDEAGNVYPCDKQPFEITWRGIG